MPYLRLNRALNGFQSPPPRWSSVILARTMLREIETHVAPHTPLYLQFL